MDDERGKYGGEHQREDKPIIAADLKNQQSARKGHSVTPREDGGTAHESIQTR
jgi:hypothetical protein